MDKRARVPGLLRRSEVRLLPCSRRHLCTRFLHHPLPHFAITSDDTRGKYMATVGGRVTCLSGDDVARNHVAQYVFVHLYRRVLYGTVREAEAGSSKNARSKSCRLSWSKRKLFVTQL